MGSGASRVGVIASKWWEAKAQKMLMATMNMGKVEVICSLLFIDEKIAIRLLKARPDLDKLFALHCFWGCTYQALWSETPRIPVVNLDMLLEDMDERLRFLRSFASVPEDEVRSTVGRILLFLKRFRHRDAIGRSL
jgi:hypothetical protein